MKTDQNCVAFKEKCIKVKKALIFFTQSTLLAVRGTPIRVIYHQEKSSHVRFLFTFFLLTQTPG